MSLWPPERSRPVSRKRCSTDTHRAQIYFFFFQAEDGIRDIGVTGVQTCALPISLPAFGWACSVGYSRLDLGVHYPSDVMAGALIGSGSALLASKLNKWLGSFASGKHRKRKRSEERRVGKECRSRWSAYH